MFFLLSFFLINFNIILSIKIGKIDHSFIQNNSSFYSSSNINCTDCLCNCLNSITCFGINCFPINSTCQLIEQNSWILSSKLLTNITSRNFIQIKQTNNTNLCSCYTPYQILNAYENMDTKLNYASTMNIRSIKYISNDHTIIVLNTTIIRKLSANNLSFIIRSLTVSNAAVSILHNDTIIYIGFALNRSISMFDLNLTFIQSSTSWSSQVFLLGGMFLYNNRILIMDVYQSIIWTINSLNQTTLTPFFSFSSYNITNATSLFIYQNNSLYISSISKNLYLFNLSNFALKQIFSLPIDIPMLFMRYDSNCDRLWFGTQNYTYAPVLDLASNQMNVYLTKGILSQYGIYSIDFDDNYMAFYADTNENLRQIPISNLNC